MDHNKKPVGATGHSHGSSSSSSSPSSTTHNLDHLFGPKDSSTSVSSSYFGSIFPPPPSTGPGREKNSGYSDGNNSNTTRGDSNVDRPCYFNSSIYYGGQENYNVPKSGSTFESSSHQPHQHIPKKDGGNDDPNGTNSNGASRGNWWQAGSLYY